MLKYLTYSIVLQEVPDEISLALEITGCPHQCPNCHSPYLRKHVGIELTEDKIKQLIDSNPDVSCICLMGGDSEHSDIVRIAKIVHNHNKRIALYSGDDEIDDSLVPYLDYYKIGSYQEDLGPLNSKTTNQIFYKIIEGNLIDITHRFQK